MTTENNKIIAKFMDYKFTTFKGIEYCKPYGHGLNCEDANLVEDLEQFSTDWNWLMEVVEKIEGFKGNKDVIHWSRNNWTIFDLKLTESKIQATYNACLEFIKWYNDQEVK